MKVNCPNCGSEVVFRSAALPSRVCDYCQTILVRRGDGVEAVGKSATLPFDVSPIRIGTRGSFENHGFEVLGRIRWGWTDGSWNEWLLQFDDGGNAWLGEAMGQYMLLRERPLGDINSKAVNLLAAGEDVPIGLVAEIDGETLTAADARPATCIAAEGELPFPPATGSSVYSVDFRSESGRCASLQREGTMPSLYDGRYVRLEEIAPRGLRAIDGWPMPAFAA